MKTAPRWVNKNLYPFQSRWFKSGECEMHYIDEGAGPVILFAHGTPDWSFGFRNLIEPLRTRYRCIAADMLGFGLSEKPPGEDYNCAAHARRLEEFIDHLQLGTFTLLGTDFGGSIGLHYAVRHPEKIDSLVLYNTWCWPLQNDPHYARPARWLNSWIGKFLYLNMNLPVNVLMRAAYADKSRLNSAVHKHYKNALPDRGSRIGPYAFSRELMAAGPWWAELYARLFVLKDKRCLLFWGMKDPLIPQYELTKWKVLFPEAATYAFSDAGHFVHEEKAEEMVRQLEPFLEAISLTH